MDIDKLKGPEMKVELYAAWTRVHELEAENAALQARIAHYEKELKLARSLDDLINARHAREGKAWREALDEDKRVWEAKHYVQEENK